MNSVTEQKPQQQLLSEDEGELKLRVYSGDGRSEIISVPTTASVGSLRLAICKALVIPSRRASLLQVGVHRSLEQRLKQRQQAHKGPGSVEPPTKQRQLELSQYKEEELLRDTAVEHLSTLLVHNCSDLAPRATYTSIKKLQSMRERGRDVDIEALNVLRSVLSRIVLRPQEAGLRRLRVSSLQRLLKQADAFPLLQLLGFVRTGELYILPEAASLDLMRTVLHELYGSENAWLQYEAEEQQKLQMQQQQTVEGAESITKPTFELKPPSKPQQDTQALPDYSSYFLLGFVVLLVALLVGNSIRSYSAERQQQQLEDSLIQEQKERSQLKERPEETDVDPVEYSPGQEKEENRFLVGEKPTVSGR